jgi:hypothetical protein
MKINKNNFLENGFIKFENLISKNLIKKIKVNSLKLIQNQTDTDLKKQISTGSMINVSKKEAEIFVDLIGYKKIFKGINQLGFNDIRWSSGYIISKPPKSPPLYWHNDWWAWNDPISYETKPSMIFVMVYLEKTTIKNGCLRVIPKSHIEYNETHKIIKKHHSKYRLYKNSNDPVYKKAKNEINIFSKPGDVIIGDARILHAAHANNSKLNRNLITLWFYPDYQKLPSRIKASAKHKWPNDWSKKSKDKLNKIFPNYSGKAKKIKWERLRKH